MTHNRIVEAVCDIAKALNDGGEMKSTGNRMADALDSIADSYGGSVDNPSGNRIADALEAIAENIEGGGGNPNYVETIEGTVANPWGGLLPAEIYEKIRNDNVTAELRADASSLEIGKASFIANPFINDRISFQAIGTTGINIENWECAVVNYSLSGALDSCFIVTSGNVTSLATFASRIPTSLTIIHHPLPESEVTP